MVMNSCLGEIGMLNYEGLKIGIQPDIHFDGKDKDQKTGKKVINEVHANNTLDSELDYDRIFSIVKRDVKSHIGKERAGLGLALSNMPSTIGAYWQVGGNYIVMNESLVRAMMKISKTSAEFNSYVYVILMHEYLHSLGYLDELQARKATAEVVSSTFPEGHFAHGMATGDIWKMYPQLLYVRGGNGEDFRVVGSFDSSSTSYIG